MKSVTFLVLVATAAGGYLAYSGTFWATGREWYEVCYALKSEQLRAGWSEVTTSDPYLAARRMSCEPISQRGIFSGGMILAGNPEMDRGSAALGNSCPSGWSDMAIGGTYMTSVAFVAAAGGPSLADRFLPAEWMLNRVYTARWPSCNSERARLGFPRIIEKAPGNFGWETPCQRCETDIVRR